jgi:CIC family chloride channel protein
MAASNSAGTPRAKSVRRASDFIANLKQHELLRRGVFSAIIGVGSALAACIIFWLLEWSTFFFLDVLAGYHSPPPAGEHFIDVTSYTPLRPWLLCLMPAIGGLITGLIVYTWAPEAEGNGTDAFIDTFHNKHGAVRPIIPVIKGVASVITLATGGSSGREGPIAQIGSGIGSWVAHISKLNAHESRLMLLAGCAGGLGAIFRAPLGGAITAIEILYKEDFETEGIILCITSSVVANAIFTSIFGSEPIFATSQVGVANVTELAFYIVLGLACVPLGWLYVKVFYGMQDNFFRKLPVKKIFRPAIGGLMLGVIAIWFPEVLSGGYGEIQRALQGDLPTFLMLTLAVLKIFATSFTISSGASGGAFGPSIFIGAMLGGAVGQLSAEWFPHIITHPAAFALVGMGGFFAGVAKAPVGALIMVCEMTGSYSLVAPLMLTSVITIALSQNWTLYPHQVRNKFDSPAHRSDRVINILQTRTVRDVFNPDAPVAILPEDMTLAQLRRFAVRTRESFFPVVDDDFHLKGVLSLPDIREALFENALLDLVVVGELTSRAVSVSPDDNLYDALNVFLQSCYDEIPIEAKEHGVVGVLRREDVMESYRCEIQKMQDEDAP